jgi:uncharacterized protein
MVRRNSPARSEVHRFSFGGEQFVLDVGRSAAFEVDEATVEALPYALEGCSTPRRLGPAVAEAWAQWRALMLQGYLRPVVPPATSAPPGHTVRTMELSATHRCTMRCRYCYAPHDGGELDMPREVIDAAVDWGVNEFANGYGELRITTGVTGEGLLNVDAYYRIRERAQALAQRTGMRITCAMGSTNLTTGSDPAVLDLIASGELNIWTVSIDGPPHIQDQARVLADGQPSYSVVSSSLASLISRGFAPIAQAVITGMEPGIVERFQHLWELGVRRFVFRPVRASNDSPFAINQRSIGAVKQAFTDFVYFLFQQDDETLLQYLQGIWWEWDFLGRFLQRTAYGQRVSYRCPGGKDVVCVDTNGDLYACPGMVGISDLRIGSVLTGIRQDAHDLYHTHLLVSEIAHCKNCWARYLCGGGCYHSAYLCNGRLDEPDPYDCELIRHLIELSIFTVNRLQSKRAGVFLALPHYPRGIIDMSARSLCQQTRRPLGFADPWEAWRVANPIHIGRADQCVNRIWRGAGETGEIHLQWDSDFLYLFVEVRGQAVTQSAGPVFGICLVPLSRLAVADDPRWWLESTDNHVISWTAGDDSALVRTGRDGYWGKRSRTPVPTETDDARAAGALRVRTMVPWSALQPLEPEAGAQFAMNASLCADGTDITMPAMRWITDYAGGILSLELQGGEPAGVEGRNG